MSPVPLLTETLYDGGSDGVTGRAPQRTLEHGTIRPENRPFDQESVCAG